MSKTIIEKHFDELEAAIQLTLNAKKHLPTLILIYSSIDILAWLNRPVTHPDVIRSDFIFWVDKYLLPGSNLNCSSLDLYAARCGIVHSYTAESKLSREGKAKQIWYAWGKADARGLENRIQHAKLDNIAVAVQVEELFNALKSGFASFITALDADPNHAKLVYERAGIKRFTNIPHNLIWEYFMSTSGSTGRAFPRDGEPNNVIRT